LPHDCVIDGRQVPLPSQVRGSVAVVEPFGHDGGAHWVPAACSWQPPPPLQKPVFPHVAAASALHCPLGSVSPAAIGLQVPRLPTSAHDMQLVLQAVVQQTPSAQSALWQSAGPAQGAPGGRRPHELLMQTFGDAQSASLAQVDLHIATPHLNGKQELAGGVTHVPAPSHVDAGVSVIPLAGQLAAPQAVPCAYSWQAPAAHRPFVRQVPVMLTQVWAGSGLFTGTLVQVPIVPDSAHDRHALAQAVAQQTPCAQLPDMHSPAAEQNEPGGFKPHELPTHTLPGEQFASRAQAPKHLLPLQAYGTHAMALGATQLPVALQVDSGVYMLLAQRSGAQTVPGRCRRQPPAPSHFPSVPQVDAGWVAHMLRGSSSPAVTGRHVPLVDGSAQLRQAPAQAWSQQTASTQWLLAQSAAAAQGWPFDFLPQLPLWHTRPATQSLSLAQRLMHAPSAHL